MMRESLRIEDFKIPEISQTESLLYSSRTFSALWKGSQRVLMEKRSEQSAIDLHKKLKLLVYLNTINAPVLQLHGMTTYQKEHIILMEDTRLGNLDYFSKKYDAMPFDLYLHIALAIADAVHFFHSRNFLLVELNICEIWLFINDLGKLSIKFGDFEKCRFNDEGKIDGLYDYGSCIDPELKSTEESSKATDIYSFGLMLSTIYLGDDDGLQQLLFPFPDNNKILSKLKEKNIPAPLHSLLMHCWQEFSLRFNIEKIQKYLIDEIKKYPLSIESKKIITALQKNSEKDYLSEDKSKWKQLFPDFKTIVIEKFIEKLSNFDNINIPCEKVRFKKEPLARGRSTIHLALLEEKLFVVKVIDGLMRPKEYSKDFFNEIEALTHLQKETKNSSKFVKLVGITVGKFNAAIILEYLPLGSLQNFLRNYSKGYPVDLCYHLALAIAKCIKLLHSSGLLHLDIKSPNILLFIDEKGRLSVKIADFGAARSVIVSGDDWHGTGPWKDPYTFAERKACESSDLFSFGTVLWELATRKHPFEDQYADVVVDLQLSGDIHLEIPEDCDPKYAELISKCRAPKLSERIDIFQIIKQLKELVKVNSLSSASLIIIDHLKEKISDNLSKALEYKQWKPIADYLNMKEGNAIPIPECLLSKNIYSLTGITPTKPPGLTSSSEPSLTF